MANIWVQFTKVWAKQHGLSYRDALKHPQLKIDYKKHKETMGEGLISDAYNYTKDRVVKTIDTLKNGRTGLPPSMQKVLDSYGNKNVVGMTIGRNPLSSVLTGALDAMSFGQFSKNNPYDKLFHLQLVIKLDDGHSLTFEKTQSPSLWVGSSTNPDMQWCSVNVSHKISLNDLVMNTYNFMSNNKFNGYSSKENNCQTFVMACLDANHLNNAQYTSFTQQNTYQLFEGLDGLRKVANTVTDLAGGADAIMQGGRVCKGRRCGRGAN